MISKLLHFYADGVSKAKTSLGSKNKTSLYDILHVNLLTDKKGLRLSTMNQSGVEKSATGTKSSTHFGSYQKRNNPNPNLPRSSLQLIQNKNNRKMLKRRL